MTARIRVLVVDDSAFTRKVLRELLQSNPEIEVVGVARDGLEALEKITELKPDVITLDLVMPNLGGLGVIQNLPADQSPRVVLVSTSDGSSELAIAALQSGAFDLIHKPTALATDQLYELGEELLRKVKAAACSGRPKAAIAAHAPSFAMPAQTSRKVLVVGTSTGGPQALTRLLSALPANFPLPIAAALHIPSGYTAAMAARLNAVCALEVQEADDGMMLRPGLVILARGGIHLKLRRQRLGVSAVLDFEPSQQQLYYPSVNVLFQSAVDCYDAGVLAAVLTGMGDDGLLGAEAIQKAGGTVLTEAESSCVIYGMPRCVVENGYSSGEVSLDDMAAALIKQL